MELLRRGREVSGVLDKQSIFAKEVIQFVLAPPGRGNRR